MNTPRAIVTADVARERRQVCGGGRISERVKHDAHVRHRRTWRDWLLTGDYEEEPVVKPGTGWEVS